MNVTLRQLRAFLAGADSASFSDAAGQLGLTQPGYSLLIRQLEAALGLRLFDRTTRRVEATRAGAELAQRLRPVLRDLDGVLRDVQALAQHRRGRATVGVMPSVGASILAGALERLGRDYPDITLQIREDYAGPLLQQVADGEVDFAIGVPLDSPAPLAFEPLLRDRLVGLFHPDAPVLDGAPITWARLTGLPYISVFGRSSVRDTVARALAVAGVELAPAYEISHVATAANLVRSGLGFAVLPELALSMASLDGVAVRPVEGPEAWRDIGIVTAERRSLSPAAEAAVEAFRAAAAAAR
jgi:DNA-binding transcriptional LysR family regulator